MATATKSKTPSDQQLLSRLRRSKKGLTASALGVPTTRIKQLAGVEVVGTVQTGKAGRPALLFRATQAELDRSGASNEQEIDNQVDPAFRGL